METEEGEGGDRETGMEVDEGGVEELPPSPFIDTFIGCTEFVNFSSNGFGVWGRDCERETAWGRPSSHLFSSIRMDCNSLIGS